MRAEPSHLIVHVVDTDETVRFYQAMFDATVRDDHQMESPSLDALFAREGVRIRSTFLDVCGYVLHTIETLDVPRTRPETAYDGIPSGIGVSGLSFKVADLDASHQLAVERGWSPTPIYTFDNEFLEHPTRLFFVRDPDGLRVELVEFGSG